MSAPGVMRVRCEKRGGLPEREAQHHAAVDILLPASFDVVIWACEALTRCPCGARCVLVSEDG